MEPTPKTKRLRSMSAIVEHYDNGDSILVSYSTVVAAIVDGRAYVTPHWDCSVTTLKHVKTYLRDYWDLDMPAADIRYMIRNNGIHVATWREIQDKVNEGRL